MKKIMWAKMTMEEIKALDKDNTVVLFPIGSTEGHGPHVSVECDSFNATELAKKVALASQEQGVTTIVTPTLRFGQSEWMDYPGKISLRTKTFQSVVWDMCKSIAIDNGFKRLIILNGHGGNPHFLGVTIQDFYQEYRVLIPVINYWRLAVDIIDEVIETSFAHADEGETSVCLALGMEIDMKKAIKDSPYAPHEKISKIGGTDDGLQKLSGFRFAQKTMIPFTKITERSKSGVFSDATLATKEKGEKIVAAVIERSTEIIKELLKYPY